LDFKPLQTITCKNCLSAVLWFEMLPTKRGKLWLGGSDSGVILRQTLFASANRESLLQNLFGASEITNTEAGTHDGSDSTRDALRCESDGVTRGDGLLTVQYTMDTATYAGTISFVRPVSRIRRVFETDNTSNYLANVGTTGNLGTHSFAPILFPVPMSFTSHTRSPTVDPADSLRWTAGKINAWKWGFQVTIHNNNVQAGEVEEGEITEFKVEIWG
jgi:hypothetical protein